MSHFQHPVLAFACLAFFLVCVVLAIATWLVFKSGEKGTTKLGGAAGCAIGAALVFVAGLMGLGALVVVGVQLKRHGHDVERWLEDDEDAPEPPDADEPGRADESEHSDEHAQAGDLVQIEVVADVKDPSEIGAVIDRLRDLTEGDFSTHLDTVRDENEGSSVLRVTISVAHERVDELKKELERTWPGLVLPHGGKLEVREL